MDTPDGSSGEAAAAPPVATPPADAAALGAVAAGATAPAAAPAADGASTPPSAAPAAGSADSSAGSEETFDRSYVEKLRDEAARYRTKAKEYEDNFDGWDPEDKALFLSLSKDLLSSDKTAAAEAAKKLRSVSDRVAQELGAIEEELERPLTKSEMESYLAEKDKERAGQEAINRILTESESLGYEKGTKAFADLIWTAQNVPEAQGQIAKAHEIISAQVATFEQAAIDKYLAGKQGQADAFPKTPSDGAAPGTTSEAPKSWKEAKAAVQAKLAAQVGS